ncbi:MAG: hypothetical protein K6F46_01060 [Desulfovibrio sp.]|nr:hypothetical protein [Desulfovibrio sp.]
MHNIVALLAVSTLFLCGFSPFACLATSTEPITSAPCEVSELWSGSLFTSTYRVGVCFSSTGHARGVLHLKLRGGQLDVYHFTGTIKGKDVEVSHPSGHRFKGRIVSADSVEGVIRLKNGMKIKLKGKRRLGIPLAPDDCAPLDEESGGLPQ